jgi:hypothetical protein
MREKTKGKQSSSLTPTQTRWIKMSTTPYLLKKKNDKAVAIKVTKQVNTRGTKQILMPKEIISIMKTKKGLDPNNDVRSPMDFREFGNLTKLGCIAWVASYWFKLFLCGLVENMDPNCPSMSSN